MAGIPNITSTIHPAGGVSTLSRVRLLRSGCLKKCWTEIFFGKTKCFIGATAMDGSERYLKNSAWLIRQILHGKTSLPLLTHCILPAAKV